MSSPRTLLLVALCALGSAAPLAAQGPVASEIRAEWRAGQTFVTWRELSAPGKRYRVYRATQALRTAADLERADLLGEVDDQSSRNQGRSLASASEHTWIVAPGGAPLASDQGLFVYTVEGPLPSPRLRARALEPRAWYAVTSVQAGVENRGLVPGANATVVGLSEWPAPPEPVLQSNGADGALYAHWVGNRDTPYQPALAPWPSRGFNFLLQRGTAPGKHGLLLSLHAAGQTYSDGWPHRFEAPSDVDLLKPSDLVPYTSWSFWFGAQEALPGVPSANTRVWNFTQQRLAWTLDAAAALLGERHDPERVYVVGGSMGAIGGMSLLSEYPERFAAALLRNGLYDLTATDYRNPGAFERLFGALSLGLRTRDGLSILERTNASFMAAREPARDWPVIRTLNGRHDETVGWMSAVGMMRGLAAAGRPAVHYFDQRTHNPNGDWQPLERALIGRTCQVRRDRPSLRFDEFSLDDDPGHGGRTDGDEVGAINAYLDYEPASASATETRLDFEVYLRDVGVLDDAPAGDATAVLTPCRTGPFRPRPGEAVHFTQRTGGKLVDEHLLFADALGRVRTPAVRLDKSKRACRFERGTPATSAELFLGAAPYAGEAAQLVLRGAPGADWTLFLRLLFPGASSGYSLVLRGVLDERGLADLAPIVPRRTPAGSVLTARALIAGRFTPIARATIQNDLRRPTAPLDHR